MFENSELRELRSRWKEMYPAARRKGIICPLCGNGSGEDGDGVTENPKSRNHSLKCFKCGFSGDVIDLKMQEKGLTFIQAVRECEGILGMTGPEALEGPNKAVKEKSGEIYPDAEKAVNEPQNGPVADYLEYYAECMERFSDPEALAYLKSRGITPEKAANYCGYDPAWISPTAAERNRKEGKPLPYPSKRIIIWSSAGPEGKLNHYVARSIDGNKVSKPNENGNGAIGFMNYDALFSQSPVFITEGAFDALAIMETGAAALSLNSTSNAKALLSRIRALEGPNREELTDMVYLCLDKDGAGNGATEALVRGFEEMGIKAADVRDKIIFAGKDANEALIADRERFFKAVKAVEQGIMAAFLEEAQSEAYKPFKTGEKWFDDLLGGGVIRQTLFLLLAAPGTGKTTLCQQIAEGMAAVGKKVIYLNLEMSRQQMIAKSLSRRLYLKNKSKPGKGLSAVDILQGYRWTPEQRKAILEEAAEYEREILGNLQYNPDGVGTDVNAISQYLDHVGAAAARKGENGPVIFLDYLHLVTGQGLDVQELMKRTVTALKTYAARYNTFCCAISASNRTSNSSGKITLESGRDSSSLEYTADYQAGLNYLELEREGAKNVSLETLQAQRPREMSLKVLKARFGMAGQRVILNYDSKSNVFWEKEYSDEEPEIPFEVKRL